MRRQKAKDPELIILWGAKTRQLTVGVTRAVGWEVLGSASKDGMHARFDCPAEWAQRLAGIFLVLRDVPDKDFSELATHELAPPHYRDIRPIHRISIEQPDLFEVGP